MWNSERIYHKVGGDVCAAIGACFDVPWPDASRGPGHCRVLVVVLSSLALFDKTLKPQTRTLIEEIVRDENWRHSRRPKSRWPKSSSPPPSSLWLQPRSGRLLYCPPKIRSCVVGLQGINRNAEVVPHVNTVDHLIFIVNRREVVAGYTLVEALKDLSGRWLWNCPSGRLPT
jgi:hypothetical protein